eukprot:scaffold5896_cov220-Chaetoceros_neogracile.AAC.2
MLRWIAFDLSFWWISQYYCGHWRPRAMRQFVGQWFSDITSSIPVWYRQAFTSDFNNDYDGNIKYDIYIGDVSASPVGMTYAKSSYAYIHRNMLIVTVHILHHDGPNTIIGSLGHFPALFPVKKTKSSVIYMDDNDESEFWARL